jgi:isocitrate dehydrogenase (NAD+)
MKLSDRLFLESCRTVAADYEGRIEFEDRIVDNMCMQLVRSRTRDVLVLPASWRHRDDLCAGLSAAWVSRPAPTSGPRRRCRAGPASRAWPTIGSPDANPTALILSGVLMLRHLGEQVAAERVETALRDVVAEGRHTTYDLGGSTGTAAYADAIIERLGAPAAAAS